MVTNTNHSYARPFKYWLTFALLVTGSWCHATVYYVDADYGSDKNSGTRKSEAWQSISKANLMAFVPGDSICFKRGRIWSGQLKIIYSGTSLLPITYTAYGDGNDPVIENPGRENESAISVKSSWVIIEHFLVRDAQRAGISLTKESTHITVRNNEATRVGMGIEVSGRHNLVINNYCHDLVMIKNTPGGDDDYGAVGIWLFGSNNEVAHNRMLNCIAPSYDYEYDGGMVEFYGDVDSCYVHHNWGENCVGAFEVGGKGQTLTDNTIAYNVSINNRVSGGFHLGGTFGVTLERFRVENNVFVDTGKRDYTIGLWRGKPEESGILYRNNIFYIPHHTRVMNLDGIRHEYNLYYLGGKGEIGVPLGPGEVIADPHFANVSENNFHLSPKSPAIDAGIFIHKSFDFDGHPVPVGRAPDIGAFEYSSK